MTDRTSERGGRQVIPRPANWKPGPPAPWGEPPRLVLGDLVAALDRHDQPLRPAFADARIAAVLVVLAEAERGPEVLLTRRSWELRSHSGEVSFPGGRLDPGESPLAAALREAQEEVGLDPAQVTVHGELAHVNAVVSRNYIVPKVATVAGRVDLAPRTTEVDRVFWVPLADLLEPSVYRSERWGAPVDRVLHFFELDDETVWGATARMLVDLLTRTR